MQIYCWQGGLHFQPDTDEEWNILDSARLLFKSLKLPNVRFGPPTRPFAKSETSSRFQRCSHSFAFALILFNRDDFTPFTVAGSKSTGDFGQFSDGCST